MGYIPQNPHVRLFYIKSFETRWNDNKSWSAVCEHCAVSTSTKAE